MQLSNCMHVVTASKPNFQVTSYPLTKKAKMFESVKYKKEKEKKKQFLLRNLLSEPDIDIGVDDIFTATSSNGNIVFLASRSTRKYPNLYQFSNTRSSLS